MRGENGINTPRLTLRPLTGADAGVIIVGVGEYDIARWLLVVPHPYTRADAEAFLAFAAGRPDHWAITHAGALIGVISCDAELGYWLAKPFHGQGFATEAVLAVLERVFADPAREAVPATRRTGNAASARVLAKAGFTYTGARIRKQARAVGAEVESRCMILSRMRWQQSQARGG
ncbi:MAG: GNAT family N-acetyltransferase [Tropicimonas sp.]|uniref:GNAT family N-acetyltransferase n=1 Tax=Tropicimonas sp. TaxID=2067044 RepID=UPI003A89D46F